MDVQFSSSEIEAVFGTYPAAIRNKLLELRQLIFDTAVLTVGVGKVEETLRWNQPSYITPVTKSGTTIRIDRVKNGTADFAMYFHCQTTLVDSFRLEFGDLLRYEGNRAILFDVGEEIPTKILRECIASALTYHLKNRQRFLC